MAWIDIDFRLRTNRTIFALPVVTAVVFPLLLAAGRRSVRQLSKPPRRRRTLDEPTSVDPWPQEAPTDKDFVSREEDDPIKALREYIQIRCLRELASEQEVVEELVADGLEREYAADMVSSVRTTGKYGEIETGTELFVNNRSAGFFKNPVFEKKARLMRRQQLAARRAREGTAEPDPALNFGVVNPHDLKAGRRGRWVSGIAIGVVALFILFAVSALALAFLR